MIPNFLYRFLFQVINKAYVINLNVHVGDQNMKLMWHDMYEFSSYGMNENVVAMC
jgi:hypothetical protein